MVYKSGSKVDRTVRTHVRFASITSFAELLQESTTGGLPSMAERMEVALQEFKFVVPPEVNALVMMMGNNPVWSPADCFHQMGEVGFASGARLWPSVNAIKSVMSKATLLKQILPHAVDGVNKGGGQAWRKDNTNPATQPLKVSVLPTAVLPVPGAEAGVKDWVSCLSYCMGVVDEEVQAGRSGEDAGGGHNSLKAVLDSVYVLKPAFGAQGHGVMVIVEGWEEKKTGTEDTEEDTEESQFGAVTKTLTHLGYAGPNAKDDGLTRKVYTVQQVRFPLPGPSEGAC